MNQVTRKINSVQTLTKKSVIFKKPVTQQLHRVGPPFPVKN